MIIKIFQYISDKCFYVIKFKLPKQIFITNSDIHVLELHVEVKIKADFLCSSLKVLACFSFFIKLHAFQNQCLLGTHVKSRPGLPFCLQRDYSSNNIISLMLKNCFKFGGKCGKLICYPLFTEAEVTKLFLPVAVINVTPLGLNFQERFSALLISFMQSPLTKPRFTIVCLVSFHCLEILVTFSGYFPNLLHCLGLCVPLSKGQ